VQVTLRYPMKNQISNKKVSLKVDVLKEGDAWVVYSPALDLSAHGSTEREALSMFDEAVHLFLQELREMGTFEEVLTELGWHERKEQEWQPPRITHRDFQVCVPA
jgi:predicted RNase H-like HicB family nuclease